MYDDEHRCRKLRREPRYDLLKRGDTTGRRSNHDDVAVVGYDNWEVLSTETRPPLTTIDMNLESLGRTAAQHLFAAIDGRATPGVHRMPCRLIIRDRQDTPMLPAFRART